MIRLVPMLPELRSASTLSRRWCQLVLARFLWRVSFHGRRKTPVGLLDVAPTNRPNERYP